MPQPIVQPQTTDKKLQQFLDELNKLASRYQYRLEPYLSYTVGGILPRLRVVDVPPKKKNKKAKKG